MRAVLTDMVECAVTLIKPIAENFEIPDGWNDLRTYASRIVSLPTGAVVKPETDPFLLELARYSAAKITAGEDAKMFVRCLVRLTL